MNESESLGLTSYNQPSDPLSAREAAGEERREKFSLEERERMTAEAKTVRHGFLHLDGWEGRSKQPVLILGETAKRYRIGCEQLTYLAGKLRRLKPGDTILVPKYAVSFK